MFDENDIKMVEVIQHGAQRFMQNLVFNPKLNTEFEEPCIELGNGYYIERSTQQASRATIAGTKMVEVTVYKVTVEDFESGDFFDVGTTNDLAEAVTMALTHQISDYIDCMTYYEVEEA